MEPAKKKILLIDDESVFRTMIYETLTRCGYIVVAKENASEGIRILKTDHFHLILLDIMMEPLDGWDTLDHIRNMSHGSDTPVIMSSGKRIDADELIRYGEQLAGVIRKPIPDEDLCNTVRDFFTWYDSLIASTAQALLAGVPASACNRWIELSKNIRVLPILRANMNPRSIPDETRTAEECLAEKLGVIERILAEKIQEYNELKTLYPIFSSS
ncbi:MAG TPA: response regulator [Methanospirillum sp.]|nr:response regulator [Methanospirillum sp.]